jgi:hypothetical protein
MRRPAFLQKKTAPYLAGSGVHELLAHPDIDPAQKRVHFVEAQKPSRCGCGSEGKQHPRIFCSRSFRQSH